MNDLLKWASDNGARLSDISICPDEHGGHCLHGSSLTRLFIPRSLFITTSAIQESTDPNLQVLKDWADTRVGWRHDISCAGLILLHSRGVRTFWRPYLAALPSPTHILNWPREWFRGTSLDGLTDHVFGLWLSILKYLKKELVDEFTQSIKDDEWINAMSLVQSRVLNVDEAALIPILDLANHSTEQTATWHPYSTTRSHSITTSDSIPSSNDQRHFKNGDEDGDGDMDGVELSGLSDGELRFSYGIKGNADLLMTYGFLDQDVSRRMIIEFDHPRHGILTVVENMEDSLRGDNRDLWILFDLDESSEGNRRTLLGIIDTIMTKHLEAIDSVTSEDNTNGYKDGNTERDTDERYKIITKLRISERSLISRAMQL